jgi:glutaredoxin
MKIRMYTLSTCPWCMKAKKFFRGKRFDFTYVDYDRAEESEQKRIQKEIKGLGYRLSFPVVFIDDEITIGYDPDRYEALLR